MTRKEHLEFCKICENRRFDKDDGIVCALTGGIADFEDQCDSFVENSVLVRKYEEQNESKKVVEAPKGKRFANVVLDSVFMFIINFLISFVISFILAIFSPELFDQFANMGLLASYLFGFIMGTTYYTLFEMYNGQTLGKFITNTKVVMENGEKPEPMVILLRTVCRFIPFESFSFLGSSNSGWHDKFSKTRVVEV